MSIGFKIFYRQFNIYPKDDWQLLRYLQGPFVCLDFKQYCNFSRCHQRLFNYNTLSTCELNLRFIFSTTDATILLVFLSCKFVKRSNYLPITDQFSTILLDSFNRTIEDAFIFSGELTVQGVKILFNPIFWQNPILSYFFEKCPILSYFLAILPLILVFYSPFVTIISLGIKIFFVHIMLE